MLKNPKWIGITFLVFIGLALSKPLLDAMSTRSPEPAKVEEVTPSATPYSSAEAEEILARVEKDTNYKPRFDKWGDRLTLMMVDLGWRSLSQSEKDSVIEYVEQNGASAVMTGDLVEGKPGVITIDHTAWEK